MITLLLQADLIQSVVMTFVSTILAVGMLPFNLWVYARAFAPANGGGGGDDEQRMGLPLGKILSQIIMLTIPLLLGITIRHKLPKVSTETQIGHLCSAVHAQIYVSSTFLPIRYMLCLPGRSVFH